MSRYPAYIPSKGRATVCTAASLIEDAWIVVEEPEYDDYRKQFGSDRLLILPFADQGITAARNWIKDHAIGQGADRHWQFDDNIDGVWQLKDRKRYRVENVSELLEQLEDWTDRYRNIGIAGTTSTNWGADYTDPFKLNQQVYCMVLVRNDSLRWRGRGSEDTDYSLQVLAGGDCTVLWTQFQHSKPVSGKLPGGNTDDLWKHDGARLARVRDLQSKWPGLPIRLVHRWGRPAMDLAQVWRRFPTRLERIDA